MDRIGEPALTTYPFSARYAYHANSSVSESEFYSAGSPAVAKRYRFVYGASSYDALNRLKSADFSSWNGSTWTSTLAHDLANISYDLAGNLTALQRYRETATLLDNLTYTNAASSNRLAAVADAVVGSAETWDAESGAFTYDATGNLLTAPAPYALTSATYDGQNLPLTITRSGVTTAIQGTWMDSVDRSRVCSRMAPTISSRPRSTISSDGRGARGSRTRGPLRDTMPASPRTPRASTTRTSVNRSRSRTSRHSTPRTRSLA